MNRRSFVIIAVAVALVLIAATIKSGWLYLVASFLLSLVAAAILAGWRSVRRVEVVRRCPGEVFEGEPFTVRLTVTNTGRLARYFLLIRDLQFGERRARAGFLERIRSRREGSSEPLDAGESTAGEARAVGGDGLDPSTRTTAIERLGPGRGVDVFYTLSAPRRGIFSEAEMSIGSGGTLGAGEMHRKLSVPSPVTVFPRSEPLAYFPLEVETSEAPVEAYEWTRKGIGEDYFGTREYVRGDSLRYVHWKSTAKQNRLIVREYQQEIRPSCGLLVALWEPVFADEESNSLEDGLRAASSIASYLDTMGSGPRLVIPSNGGFEEVGDGTLVGCLRALAAYRPPGGEASEDLSLGLSLARDAFAPRGALTVVTNSQPAAVARSLPAGSALAPISLVLVLDDSYGWRWSWEDSADGLLDLSTDAGRAYEHLFLIARGSDIGKCLSEPYVTIDY